MGSKTLSKSEIKEALERIKRDIGIEAFSKKDTIVLVSGEITYLRVNGNVDYFLANDKYVPTLKSLLRNNFLKNITIDMGAVKFIVSGADVMRPGIVEIDDGITSGGLVAVVDVNNKKPLAVGIALMDSPEMKDAKTGKCIKNVHFIGDEIWKIE